MMRRLLVAAVSSVLAVTAPVRAEETPARVTGTAEALVSLGPTSEPVKVEIDVIAHDDPGVATGKAYATLAGEKEAIEIRIVLGRLYAFEGEPFELVAEGVGEDGACWGFWIVDSLDSDPDRMAARRDAVGRLTDGCLPTDLDFVSDGGFDFEPVLP